MDTILTEQDFILDIHTHTIASGHAYGTIREMAQAANERGLLLLGLSDHAPGILLIFIILRWFQGFSTAWKSFTEVRSMC